MCLLLLGCRAGCPKASRCRWMTRDSVVPLHKMHLVIAHPHALQVGLQWQYSRHSLQLSVQRKHTAGPCSLIAHLHVCVLSSALMHKATTECMVAILPSFLDSRLMLLSLFIHLLPAVAGLVTSNTVHHSPGGTALGKRGRSSSSKKGSHKPVAPCHTDCYTAGVPLLPEIMSDSHSGHKVLVYWPADQQWWEATLCRVRNCCQVLLSVWLRAMYACVCCVHAFLRVRLSC